MSRWIDLLSGGMILKDYENNEFFAQPYQVGMNGIIVFDNERDAIDYANCGASRSETNKILAEAIKNPLPGQIEILFVRAIRAEQEDG